MKWAPGEPLSTFCTHTPLWVSTPAILTVKPMREAVAVTIWRRIWSTERWSHVAQIFRQLIDGAREGFSLQRSTRSDLRPGISQRLHILKPSNLCWGWNRGSHFRFQPNQNSCLKSLSIYSFNNRKWLWAEGILFSPSSGKWSKYHKVIWGATMEGHTEEKHGSFIVFQHQTCEWGNQPTWCPYSPERAQQRSSCPVPRSLPNGPGIGKKLLF